MALRARRRDRHRHRRQAIPFEASLPNCIGLGLHRLDLCARLGTMAAHRIGRRLNDSARLWKWLSQVRRRYRSHDSRLVRLLATDHRDDRSAGDASEYECAGQVDGRLNG